MFFFHSEFAGLRETAKNLGLGDTIEVQLNRCVNIPNKHWHFKYKSIKLACSQTVAKLNHQPIKIAGYIIKKGLKITKKSECVRDLKTKKEVGKINIIKQVIVLENMHISCLCQKIICSE